MTTSQFITDKRGFYPTPSSLINKMVSKIQGQPENALEPSAGKGDIVEYLTHDFRYSRSSIRDVSAIEIDPDLQATLRGKGYKVIDSDFLAFSGPDKFDLIIANPPFDTGDLHLLKAIDIMYRGEIVFLLNAETIKNPYTNTRKELIKRLVDLDADIEYIQGAFKNAERPTGVEIALVYINIKRNVEDDLFQGATDKTDDEAPDLERKHEISTGRTVEELVAEYNETIKIGTDTIIGYYRNFKKIGGYIGLNCEADKNAYRSGDMTSRMQKDLNDLLKQVRTVFWRKTLDIREVRDRLTTKKANEFEDQLKQHCDMDFTERNIRAFVLNIIGGYEKTLTEAVLEIFELFTKRHCYSDGLYDDNIHYFNGWKTNNAFKVRKKVIIPIYAGYSGGPFTDSWDGKWKLAYDARNVLRDIDTVMNYFDGMEGYYHSMNDAIESAFSRGQSRNIHSTYFTITTYKKGTIHLTFNSEDILRRFNVVACKGKEWLPHDYGRTAYDDLPQDKQDIVESFEGKKSYSDNLNAPLLGSLNVLSIADMSKAV